MSIQQSPHAEKHRSHRAPWLRAAVLGVNDGLVSVSSIMLGVLAASHDRTAIITAGVAGLVAGAMSMGAGEYVSVSSQRDSEQADVDIERRSLRDNPDLELAELARIYEGRGLDANLAQQVAVQLHAHDAIGAHARDELGIDHEDLSKPGQAAAASMLAFVIGAVIPLIAAVLSNNNGGGKIITIVTLIALAASGAIGAYVGGGHRVRAALRVLLGGGVAMLITYAIGHLAGQTL